MEYLTQDERLQASSNREQLLAFRPRIACRRGADHPPTLMTAATATHKVLDKLGSTTLCESYTGDTLVKPFFDYDSYSDEAQDPASVFARVCQQPLEHALGVRPEQLAVASRSDWVIGNAGRRWKTSLRVFVQGLRLKVSDLVHILAAEEFSDPGWDKGIYPEPGKERLLAVVGGIKGGQDRRQLRPLPGTAPRPYAHYLIQFLYDDEAEVDVQPVHRARRARGLPDEREAPSMTGKNNLLPISEAGMLQAAVAAMAAVRMTGCRPTGVRWNSVYFVNDGQRRCVHGTFHDHNNCYLNFMNDGDIVYHCCSGRCDAEEDVPIGKWEADPTAVVLDELPPSCRAEFDPGVIVAIKDLAETWPDHGEAFVRICLAYMNRCLPHDGCRVGTAFRGLFLLNSVAVFPTPAICL